MAEIPIIFTIHMPFRKFHLYVLAYFMANSNFMQIIRKQREIISDKFIQNKINFISYELKVIIHNLCPLNSS